MGYNGSKTPKSDRDEWRTPPWLFKWLNSIYHFDIDLAASEDNHLCPMYFSKELDALEANWNSHPDSIERTSMGYCNPPYSDIYPWLEKAVSESMVGFTTAFVVPTPNGDARDATIFSYASKIIYIVGRVGFYDKNGRAMSGNPRGTCVVVIGPGKCGPPKLEWVVRNWIEEQYGQ